MLYYRNTKYGIAINSKRAHAMESMPYLGLIVYPMILLLVPIVFYIRTLNKALPLKSRIG
jgi:hypothetical protein